MEIQGRIKDGQVIVAPSFGARKDSQHDLSNLGIAKHIMGIYRIIGLPMIFQKEVASAFRSLAGGKDAEIVKVIEEDRVKGKRLDTYEVLAQAFEVIKKRGWNKVILVAHPDHIWRAKKVLEKMRLKVLIPSGLEDIPFDPHSSQWWTRGPLVWWLLWEIRARIFYKLKGYI
ncbi:hypothetical protein KKA24_00115 [Patescibacteria group bacterium]|nr:hypothetical protein [Patescibacteria group bacterium]